VVRDWKLSEVRNKNVHSWHFYSTLSRGSSYENQKEGKIKPIQIRKKEAKQSHYQIKWACIHKILRTLKKSSYSQKHKTTTTKIHQVYQGFKIRDKLKNSIVFPYASNEQSLN
jgi:hypothetical protein